MAISGQRGQVRYLGRQGARPGVARAMLGPCVAGQGIAQSLAFGTEDRRIVSIAQAGRALPRFAGHSFRSTCSSLVCRPLRWGRFSISWCVGSQTRDQLWTPRKTSVVGVRRGKAGLSSGCKSHPATAPAGSNRSGHGGDEVAEAFGIGGHALVAARVCRSQRE